jgi:hypothetical protein
MHNRVRERGVTLLDTVVGTSLMLVVFVGIAAAFQLAVYAVGNNKSRAGAIALANERLEYVRSLPYDSVGTVGGIPAGALAQSETISLNDVAYTRRTFISYEDDPGDGVGGADSNGIPVDYRAAKVSVSWESRQGTRTVTMTTRLSPPTGVESAVPGGTLAIRVTNDADAGVANAQVRIVNPGVAPAIDMTTFTDSAGLATILGAPAGAGYQVTATKSGYSTAQTYSASATNTNPIPAHLGVALNQTTAATFEIDLLSTLVVQTFEPIKEELWNDMFADASKLATQNGTTLSGGAIVLDGETTGSAVSVGITPQRLAGWKEFSWNGTTPVGTNLKYHVYTDSGALVPDADLAGNGAGFTNSPVSLLSLATSSYPTLRLGAELSSSDASTTPDVQSWQITYDAGPTPLPGISFTMQGAKTIGAGPQGPVSKYSVSHSSGSEGSVSISNVEYDTYTLSVPSSSGYDISSSCAAQPTVIVPSTSMTTQLYLMPHTANSLLIDVRSAGGAIVSGASVRLSRAPYDTTIASDACGQAFFSGLSAGSVGTDNPYTINVTAAGFLPYTSTTVNVTGTSRLSIILDL